MTATPEELLRLARKAWPVGDAALTTTLRNLAGMLHKDEAVAHRALHAALLVLAGELDLAALLAERDRLQARLAGVGRFDATGDGNSRCAGCGFAVRGEPRRLTVTLPKEEP